jgi:hypothetical protein
MGLIRIQIHLNRVNRFEWVQTLGTVARPTCQWCHVPYIKSPAEHRPTRRHRDRVLPPSGSPPSPCASLADPPPPRPLGGPYRTPPPPLLPCRAIVGTGDRAPFACHAHRASPAWAKSACGAGQHCRVCGPKPALGFFIFQFCLHF